MLLSCGEWMWHGLRTRVATGVTRKELGWQVGFSGGWEPLKVHGLSFWLQDVWMIECRKRS